MNRLEKIRQRCLKEKAAMILKVSIKKIEKVEEHPNRLVGATVYMKSGISPWINIPTDYWIGEKLA